MASKMWSTPKLITLASAGNSEGGTYPNVTEIGNVTQGFTSFHGARFDTGNGSPFNGASFS